MEGSGSNPRSLYQPRLSKLIIMLHNVHFWGNKLLKTAGMVGLRVTFHWSLCLCVFLSIVSSTDIVKLNPFIAKLMNKK